MKSQTSSFQSFLIIKNQFSKENETQKLAKTLGITLKKNSPDLFLISAENQHITIDQVRQLKRHIFQKPLRENYKLVIIEEAEKLTIEAQNALLKILEEPPTKAIIILEAKDASLLLPTIISRVKIIKAEESFKPTDINSSILFDEDIFKSLEKVAGVKEATIWLDQQILQAHQLLLTKTQVPSRVSTVSPLKIAQFIEKCAQTKLMIEANVNPKFALINLILTKESASK